MEDFLTLELFKKFFTDNINVNTGMAVLFCLVLILGTRAIRAFLTMVDIAVIPIKELCAHLNKWSNGWLGKFFFVGNCGLWLLLGMFTSGFGFAEYRLDSYPYFPASVAYGVGWGGVGITIIASLAICRLWLRLEDPKKKLLKLQNAKVPNEKV